MGSIREYILSVTAAALFCGCMISLGVIKGPSGAVIKVILGIFMALCVLSPLTQIRIGDMKGITLDFQQEAQEAVAQGQAMAREEISGVIARQAEAYILDKAGSLGLSVSVQIQLSQTDIPKPCAVVIKGSVSPYKRQVLSGIIKDSLGIETEAQTWIA